MTRSTARYGVGMPAADLATLPHHAVFQSSIMSALLDGVYDGELTIGELLEHGDFGLGAFNALDGEMIILDGVCHRLRSDGGVTTAAASDRTPFAVVTSFAPRISVNLPGPASRADVVAVVEDLMASENYLYAIRVTGHFDSVRTRTVSRQERPYRPLAQVTKGEPVAVHTGVDGVVAGFRTPLYEQGIGVPGGHVHFVDDERRRGGHVLDYQLRAGTLDLCLATDLHLALPLTEAFRGAHLSPADLAAQVEATERHA